ncbi:unnamed protein product [Urochloa decumbens]|uniref:Prolamin-like domain-containing protein n=1 Tax=Urochloa decumbens TaxID=240449 RepID=A0ABC9F5W1_9POAL
MRPSLLPVVALLAAAAACLAQAGAEPATPRRSLTSGFLPTVPSSDDWDWCWESLLALGLCKHDLLASFLAGRPAPRECCLAADEAGHHCGPLTRAFLGSILPRDLLAQCAHQQVVTGGAPTTRPSQRRAPPRAPTLETGPRASGGARPPPAPEARTDARSPPPRTPPAVSVRKGEESPPELKVIVAGGSAGRRARRAPGAGAPPAPAPGAAPTLQKGVPAARPSAKVPPVE